MSHYTPADDRYLRRMYGRAPAAQIARHLKRSANSVHQRARKLGLSRASTNRAWSDADDAMLREHWPDVQAAAQALGRSPKSVKLHARRIGLPPIWRRESSGTPWTAAEDAIVRKHYDQDGAAGVQRLLPHRSRRAIETRNYALKRRTSAK